MKLKPLIRAVAPWVAIPLLFLGCRTVAAIDAEIHTPPESVTNFADFLKWTPHPAALYRTEIRGHPHLIAMRHRNLLVSLINLPSGDPVYVFDSTGHLIDWAIDSGDDYRFQRTWGNWFQSSQVTVDEATRFTRRQG